MRNKHQAEALATIIVLIEKEIEFLKMPRYLHENEEEPKIELLEQYVNRFTKELDELI